MNKPRQHFLLYSVFVVFIFLLLSSCTTYKDITYLRDIPNSANNRPVEVVASGIDTFESLRIQPYDVLQVTIHTLDPQVNGIFNQTSEGIASNTANSGILVDRNGMIVLPVLGKVKVDGLTTSEARDTINQIANIYLKDPIVNVRIANFKITILGEVSRPSQYIITDEKVSIIDAIGLAGDLTTYGKRENVLLVRHNNNERKYVRVDLSNSKFTNSPYYYLKQGDVLYVEPIKYRSTLVNPKIRDLAVISGVISLVAFFIAFAK